MDRYFFGMCYKIHENNFSQKEVNEKGSKYKNSYISLIYCTGLVVVPLISVH